MANKRRLFNKKPKANDVFIPGYEGWVFSETDKILSAVSALEHKLYGRAS